LATSVYKQNSRVGRKVKILGVGVGVVVVV